jgi:hypothetical protein
MPGTPRSRLTGTCRGREARRDRNRRGTESWRVSRDALNIVG